MELRRLDKSPAEAQLHIVTAPIEKAVRDGGKDMPPTSDAYFNDPNSTVPWLISVCDLTLGELEEESHLSDPVRAVRERLADPVRVAVGGRLKAGKSTLVNALLGRRIAGTDFGECTRVVTWFRHHYQEKIEVFPRDGEPWTLPPTVDGSVPPDLGAEAAEIDCVIVWLSAKERLSQLILIDTPGLDSLNTEFSENARRALLDPDSRTALRNADGLVYLMPHPGDTDRAFLEAFHESQTAAMNAVGVLSKIDLLAGGRGDPWPAAQKVADNYARKLKASVATVVPVAGLIAETAVADQFTERDAEALRELAGLDRKAREALLEDPAAFMGGSATSLPAEDRRNLLAQLGMYGLVAAFGLMDDGARGATELLRGLRDLSGIDELRKVMNDVFGSRANALRAASAMRELQRISYFDDAVPTRRALSQLRERLEDQQSRPAIRLVQEMEVLRAIDDHALALPKDAERLLLMLIRGESAASKLGLESSAISERISKTAKARLAELRVLESELHRNQRVREARAVRVVRESVEDFVLGEEMVGRTDR
jgi:hypothetical protein